MQKKDMPYVYEILMPRPLGLKKKNISYEWSNLDSKNK